MRPKSFVLFWHDHFATSMVKVQNPTLMFRQNCLLEHALGRFGPMLQAISRDGAMLVWLDSNSNIKGKPNENYARELMELFSLGVETIPRKTFARPREPSPDVQEAPGLCSMTGCTIAGPRPF